MSAQLTLMDIVEQRDRILDAFRENHKVYLVALRSFARTHALKHRTVTIDDVREAMVRSQFPMPKDIGADERVMGAVFSGKEFVPIKQVESRRPERIKRSGRGASMVTVYRLREAV